MFSMTGELQQPDARSCRDVPLDRRDAIVGVGLAAAALAAYVATLAPEWMDSDCAEFYTQAVKLGYAHPTGYPVYLFLAKAATWLPIGQIPYRVNLLSAIAGAAATGLMYLFGRLLTLRRWPPLAGAVALAVSPTFWSQAIIAKVYTSGIVFMLAVLACLELWRRSGRLRWLFAAGCLGGVSLGVHVTHSLMAPAVLVLLAVTPRRWKANWTTAAAGAAAGAAITLAAYAAIDRIDSPTSYFRAVLRPSRSEFHLSAAELDSFRGRLKLCFFPPQYTPLLFSKPLSVFQEKVQWHVGNLQHEFPLPWLGLSLLGIYWLGQRNWRMTMLLLLTWATHLGYDLVYDMGGVQVLYLAAYVPLIALAVAGLACLGDGCAGRGENRSRPRRHGRRPIGTGRGPLAAGLARGVEQRASPRRLDAAGGGPFPRRALARTPRSGAATGQRLGARRRALYRLVPALRLLLRRFRRAGPHRPGVLSGLSAGVLFRVGRLGVGRREGGVADAAGLFHPHCAEGRRGV